MENSQTTDLREPLTPAILPREEDRFSLHYILEENKRRKALLKMEYDPIRGEEEAGRYLFELKDFGPLWLPVEMKDEPLVQGLERRNQIEEGEKKMFDMVRIRHDFPFWAASYAYIKPKGGGEDRLFVLNRPQRKLVAKLEEMRRRGKPIRLILLKARQWGGSTCVQLYMAWLQLVHETGLNSLIVANYTSAADEIKDMFDRMLAKYPSEMLESSARPEGESNDRKGRENRGKEKRKLTEKVGSGGAVRVLARNCKVKIATAENPDSCRGGDYNLVHCSEVGLWKATRLKTPSQIVRSACSGVLLTPMTMIVYESTANGTGNFFHREYEAARKGESQFEPLFVAWYEIGQYSQEFEEGEEAEFASLLLSRREQEDSVSVRFQPGSYLWHLWESGATLEAIHWYVEERMKYDDHGQMASEYPSDEIEAFVHSGAKVFDRTAVENLRKSCRKEKMLGEIEGKRVSGREALEKVRFHASDRGLLRIWKDYDPGEYEGRITGRYLAVVDIGGRSRTSDWSVIAVFDRAPMLRGEGPEVVAQWRGHIDFDLLAWKAAAIAKYYDNALLVVESNTIETHDPDRAVEGNQSGYFFSQLADVYPNLYMRRQSEEAVNRGIESRYGFHTNISTKPMIITGLVKAVREGSYTERDEGCIEEYLTYEQRQNGSYGALSGYHDDMLMTRAIGLYICFSEMDFPRFKPWGEPSTGDEDLGICSLDREAKYI